MKPTVPPQLAKRGITQLQDNLEGRVVKLAPGALALLFGDEIRERFMKPEPPHGQPSARPGPV